MQGDEQITRRDPIPIEYRLSIDLISYANERVDHRVTHKVNAPLIDSFPDKILTRFRRVNKQQARCVVDDNSIDFLLHAEIKAAQSGLYMGERYSHLRSGETTGQRRVDVTSDDYDGGLFFCHHGK